MMKSHFNFKSDIDCLAHDIFNYYNEKLRENNFRIFAKDAGIPLFNADEYELNAFKKWFKVYFKTNAQFRKTQHIKSDAFVITLLDFYERPYESFFVGYIAQYNAMGNKYLADVLKYFKNNIDYRIKNKNKENLEQVGV